MMGDMEEGGRDQQQVIKYSSLKFYQLLERTGQDARYVYNLPHKN